MISAGLRFGALKNTEVISEFIQDKIIRNFVICIDDLERKEDGVTGSALLGFITSLREERNCKVVLLYNHSEIPDDLAEPIAEYREKVIDREITYTPSVEENYQIIFPEGSDQYLPSTKGTVDIDPIFGRDDRNVLDLLQSLDVTNIRVIRKTKDALEFFKEPLRPYPKMHPHFMRQVVKLCCLHYLFGKRLPLSYLLRSSLHTRLNDDAEKAKELERRNPVQDIGYHPRDTDSPIAEYLRTGYVRWDQHQSLLAASERHHERTKLNSQHRQVWSMFWGNFSASHDEFVAAQIAFLNRNWEDLTLKDVDAGVRFLLKLDPSLPVMELLDKKIDRFVAANIDEDIADIEFHGINPDSVRKIQHGLSENFEAMPVADAVERLAGSDGWDSKDVKNLVNVTPDEFFHFFTTTTTSDLLVKIKDLRMRLMASRIKSGKAVVARLDEALDRLAKRSKLDELRVQRLGLEDLVHEESGDTSNENEGEP